jgi:hypothetical protein
MHFLQLMHLHPALTGLIAGPVLGGPAGVLTARWRQRARDRRQDSRQRDRLLGIPAEYRNGGSR